MANALQTVVEWEWDGRFGTVLAEFPVGEKDKVLGRLEQHLVGSWDRATIRDATDRVQAIVKRLGGLMSGQLLLLSDSATDVLIYCGWWPWGDGLTISIRVGMFGETSDADAAQALANVLKATFSVPQGSTSSSRARPMKARRPARGRRAGVRSVP